MCQPSEELARLCERRHVLRPSGEYGGMCEGCRGRRLGRLGDGQQRGAGTGQRFDPALPVDGVEQYRRVEAELGAGARAGPVPARRDPARRGGHRLAGQHPVPVGDVVPYLRRRQHQRDGRRQACALAPGDGRGAHGAQRAGARGAPGGGGSLGLSLSQNRDDQAVVVGHDPGELTVVGAKCQTEPAQMGHPLGLEPVGEAMSAWPDDSEHDGPPRVVQQCGRHRIEPSVNPDAPTVTRLARLSYFEPTTPRTQEES